MTASLKTSEPRSSTRPRGSSFAGLVGVELRRLWWRRLTKAALIGVVAFVGAAVFASYQQTQPEALAQRIDEYQTMVAEQTRQNAAMPAEEKAATIEACRRDEASAQADNPSTDFNCDRMFAPPDPSDFGIVAAERNQITSDVVGSGVYAFAFLAFMLGASFIAAEFAAGSMGNWLTFQPRRLRVGASKLISASIGGLGIGALGVGLASLGATLVTTINRPGADLPLPQTAPTGDSPGQLLLRVAVVSLLGGLGGAVIGLLLRSTAGVIGVIVGWLVVVEGLVGSAFGEGRLQPWLLRTNLEGFINDGTTYYATQCGTTGCQTVSVPHSYTASWLYLLLVSAVGIVAALASFRRRDVT